MPHAAAQKGGAGRRRAHLQAIPPQAALSLSPADSAASSAASCIMLSDTRRRPGTLDCPQLACGMKSASGECGARGAGGGGGDGDRVAEGVKKGGSFSFRWLLITSTYGFQLIRL